MAGGLGASSLTLADTPASGAGGLSGRLGGGVLGSSQGAACEEWAAGKWVGGWVRIRRLTALRLV